jgi:phosphate transport system permease protein
MIKQSAQKRGWFSSGSPWIWLNAGAVSLCMIMVVGLIALIAVRGFGHFWPSEIISTQVNEKGSTRAILGEMVRSETISAVVAREAGLEVDEEATLVTRHLLKLGNRDVDGRDFVWFLEHSLDDFSYPTNAMVIERRSWGHFFGFPQAIKVDGKVVVENTDSAFLETLSSELKKANNLHDDISRIEKSDIGKINNKMETLRLDYRRLELSGASSEELAIADAELQQQQRALQAQYQSVKQTRDDLLATAGRVVLVAKTASEKTVEIPFANMVRVTFPNDLSLLQKMGSYADRFWEFVSAEPREANTEGGIFPAIFGTVTMVLVMSIIVCPFGVLAAIYLREYAKQGPVLKLIRISVYNLAGVPSIVYGVFGLGFFVYTLGGSLDQLFYAESLPSPTFGTPGLFWASLTLALLTLPVVIVSTEEGLSRIPSTIRQGSLALGATKAETLWKVVVPLATPAMMTGLILAIARAAGEVAPLMLVGVVKLAPSLPIDGNYPYLHLDQKIMHLGFHIFDVGFQSPNVEAARPLVYATALILIILIIALNITAIKIRNNLREKYRSAAD